MAPMKGKLQQLGQKPVVQRLTNKFRRNRDDVEPNTASEGRHKALTMPTCSPSDQSSSADPRSVPSSNSTSSTSSILCHPSSAAPGTASTVASSDYHSFGTSYASTSMSYHSSKMSPDGSEINATQEPGTATADIFALNHQGSGSGSADTNPSGNLDFWGCDFPASSSYHTPSRIDPSSDLVEFPYPRPSGPGKNASHWMPLDGGNLHNATSNTPSCGREDRHDNHETLYNAEDDLETPMPSANRSEDKLFSSRRLARLRRSYSKTTQEIPQGGGHSTSVGYSFSRDIWSLYPFDGPRALPSFGKMLADLKCSACNRDLKVTSIEAISAAQDRISKSSFLTNGVQCRHCKHMNGLGCGCRVDKLEAFAKSNNCGVMACCDFGRMYVIWLFCLGTELAAGEKMPKATTKSLPSKPSTSSPSANVTNAASTSSPSSHHYMPTGVGYGGGSSWEILCPNMLKPKPSSSKIVAPSTHTEDNLLEGCFNILASLLPQTRRPDQFGDKPPCVELLSQILRHSPLVRKAAELLRNTAIDDITKRHTLYLSLEAFITTLSSHQSTVHVVSSPIMLYPPSEQLLAHTTIPPKDGSPLSSSGAVSNGKAKAVAYDTTRSLASIISQVSGLYKGILHQGTLFNKDFTTKEGQDMLKVCRKYSDLINFLIENRIIPKSQSSESSAKPVTLQVVQSEADKRAAFVAWHQENSVSDVPDERLLMSFYFASQARQVKSTAIGRMKKLITEINTMRASLPEGIYVRHGSSRLDVMKAMITGPKGTPYEGGMFEFDIFCPANFPTSPPLMRIKTTGGWRFRFNPNLYEDGTVCLSIINTWSQGQTWDPTRSTLLQVLLSIQSMIFCAKPWYNEPGREGKPNEAASNRENEQLQGHTIEHAMLYWLKQLVVGDTADTQLPIWGKVVRMHFENEGRKIMQTVGKWKGARMLGELAVTLQKHGFPTG